MQTLTSRNWDQPQNGFVIAQQGRLYDKRFKAWGITKTQTQQHFQPHHFLREALVTSHAWNEYDSVQNRRLVLVITSEGHLNGSSHLATLIPALVNFSSLTMCYWAHLCIQCVCGSVWESLRVCLCVCDSMPEYFEHSISQCSWRESWLPTLWVSTVSHRAVF